MHEPDQPARPSEAVPSAMDDVGNMAETWREPRPVPADPERLLTIGEFARRSWLSMKALRLYERQGLLAPDHVDASTGYRYYRERQLATARMVAMLRRLDMPLSRVAEIVGAGERAPEILAEYWAEAEERFAAQRELAAHLGVRLAGGRPAPTAFPPVERRDVAEQVVLTERRHVRVSELPGFVENALPRQRQAAEELGGVAGHQFAIFHGTVNQDSDGPVEVCTPIDPAAGVPADVAVRREPAHREAFVRVRKAQFVFPQVMSGYDAVAVWIHRHGLSVAASPREIYLTDDVAAAKPDDAVCDIAFPVS